METIAQVRLRHIHCCRSDCNVLFGLNADYDEAKRRDHSSFYCPNGHSQHFPGESKEERLRRELHNTTLEKERAERNARVERERREAVERSEAATRGYLTRIKNRVAAGVCPCCTRSFKQLARHMASQHPEYPQPKEKA